MTAAYATASAAAGLATTAFTWSTGATADKDALNDGRMSKTCSSGSSGASPIYLTMDLGSAKAIKGFAILNHNIADYPGVSVTVEAADDLAFTVNAVTVKAASTITTTEPNHKDAVLTFQSVTKRYWRLRFNYASPPYTITLGEVLVLQTITSLSRSKAYGWGESERYFTNMVRSRTGETHATFLAGPRRTKRWPFVDLQGTSQREELMAMFRASKGNVTPCLWLEDYNATSASAATSSEQECLWGRLREALGWTEGDYTLYGVDALELEELGRQVGA